MDQPPIIVGAGPTGLSAALFLAARGVRSRIIDQAAAPAKESRAQVVNPRALELLAETGVAERMGADGHSIHRTLFYDGWTKIAELDFGDAHPRYRMTVLPQARSEALLATALQERYGLKAERNLRFEDLRQDADGVTAIMVHADGAREEARTPILLGADGARSRVREALAIPFEGSAFPEEWLLYDLALNDPLDLESAHVSFVKGGLVFLLGIRPGQWRVFADVSDPLQRLPAGARPGEAVWTSSFHISHRLAAREVVGRVALAGDAAHIHSPIAARGMNLGIEDAYVFARYAEQALLGQADALEAYGRRRHQVHHNVIARIRALTEVARGQPDILGALRRYLIPGMTHIAPGAMLGLLTGLDHPVDMAPPLAARTRPVSRAAADRPPPP